MPGPLDVMALGLMICHLVLGQSFGPTRSRLDIRRPSKRYKQREGEPQAALVGPLAEDEGRQERGDGMHCAQSCVGSWKFVVSWPLLAFRSMGPAVSTMGCMGVGLRLG